MKAVVTQLDALTLDRITLQPLPDGTLDVQIRFYGDQEAFQHIYDYIKAQGYERKQLTATHVMPIGPLPSDKDG